MDKNYLQFFFLLIILYYLYFNFRIGSFVFMESFSYSYPFFQKAKPLSEATKRAMYEALGNPIHYVEFKKNPKYAFLEQAVYEYLESWKDTRSESEQRLEWARTRKKLTFSSFADLKNENLAWDKEWKKRKAAEHEITLLKWIKVLAPHSELLKKK